MFELTDPVVTADTNVNIHQPEDEPLQQKDEEVESEEEEDTEQQQEAIPLQPLLPPPPAVTERGCQASIGPPVQDINLQTGKLDNDIILNFVELHLQIKLRTNCYMSFRELCGLPWFL